jgi:hypothetical protein
MLNGITKKTLKDVSFLENREKPSWDYQKTIVGLPRGFHRFYNIEKTRKNLSHNGITGGDIKTNIGRAGLKLGLLNFKVVTSRLLENSLMAPLDG